MSCLQTFQVHFHFNNQSRKRLLFLYSRTNKAPPPPPPPSASPADVRFQYDPFELMTLADATLDVRHSEAQQLYIGQDIKLFPDMRSMVRAGRALLALAQRAATPFC